MNSHLCCCNRNAYRKGEQGLDTIRRGAAGRDLVAFQVRSLLKSDWQNIDAENDDAIDGAVLLRHRGKFLGRMLFVQVKSGPSFKLNYQQARFQGRIGVKHGKERSEEHTFEIQPLMRISYAVS